MAVLVIPKKQLTRQHMETIFAGKKKTKHFTLKELHARPSRNDCASHQEVLIAINDVRATKLSVKCGDCVKIKQRKAFFTSIYFTIAKAVIWILK